MKKIFWMILILLAFLPSFAYSETLGERAIEYTTNYLTGVQMKEDDWFTKEARKSANLWKSFGGFSTFIERNTQNAKNHSGVKLVKVLNTKKNDGLTYVDVEVIFNDNTKFTNSEPWTKEGETWKITLSPNFKDSFAP